MTTESATTPFQLRRIGLVMEANDDPNEAWGVLNPASARRGNELFLFPRVVAEGNYSRIGIARVCFDNGDPCGAERLGYVLEPEAPYEKDERHGGGVEDPRITYVEPLGLWVMAYVAVSRIGPRIALAVSDDLFHWDRLGPIEFAPDGADFNRFSNKDGMLFPDVVTGPEGKPALALLHRPTYLVHEPDGTIVLEVPPEAEDNRESIWIGYMSLEEAKRDIHSLIHVSNNRFVAAPFEPWEHLKIGGGTPPVRIAEGWLTYYHGVQGEYSLEPGAPKHVVYSAGALVLDTHDPTKVVYRSKAPVLTPSLAHEQEGIVPNVVFPTAVDCRENGRLDVYYGAADSTIAAACTEVSHPEW